MEFNLTEVLKGLSDENVFEIAQKAKAELSSRYSRILVLEPTGNTERDNMHYERVRRLQDFLDI